MQREELHDGLLEAADRWADSPIRARTCTVLADHPDLVEDLLSPSTLEAVPWPWKVSFCLNAAVHALVIDGAAPTLVDYVPSVGGARPLDSAFDDALLNLLTEDPGRVRALTDRPLRTQDPRQSLGLHRLLQGWAGHFEHHQRWHLVNLGCAAGFELLLGDPAFCGEDPLYPAPARRTGIDTDPIDVEDPTARTWLLACTDAGSPQIAGLVRDARGALRKVEHTVLRGEAIQSLPGVIDPEDPTLVVSHQFLCSVEDPSAVAEAVRELPPTTRWLSVEVPTATAGIHPIEIDGPTGTPVATLLDRDLRVLAQAPAAT